MQPQSARGSSWAAIPAGFLAGAVPFSNLMAYRVQGVDLRRVGTGTVSGTALYHVAGFRPRAAAGVFEVAKGAVGPALAGRDQPALAATAAAADGATDLLDAIQKQVQPETAFVGSFSPVMVAHTGAGLLGLAWWWET